MSWYDELFRRLRAFALKKGLRFCDAEDLAGDAVFKVWQKYRDKPEHEQLALGITIVRRSWVDLQRKWACQKTALTLTPDADMQGLEEDKGHVYDLSVVLRCDITPDRMLAARELLPLIEKRMGARFMLELVGLEGPAEPAQERREKTWRTRLRKAYQEGGVEGLRKHCLSPRQRHAMVGGTP